MQTQPPPLQQAVTDTTGRAARPWAIWFQGVANFVATVLNYQTVQAAGVNQPQEAKLNFLAPFTVTDNPGGTSTDIGLGAAITRGTVHSNANGSYFTWSDGLIEQWGLSAGIPTGSNKEQVSVVFPIPFTAVPNVTISPNTFPAGVTGDSMTCYPVDITTTGFSACLTAAVNVGGSGAPNLNNPVQVNFRAIGF
jgi:hypothetical protein